MPDTNNPARALPTGDTRRKPGPGRLAGPLRAHQGGERGLAFAKLTRAWREAPETLSCSDTCISASGCWLAADMACPEPSPADPRPLGDRCPREAVWRLRSLRVSQGRPAGHSCAHESVSFASKWQRRSGGPRAGRGGLFENPRLACPAEEHVQPLGGRRPAGPTRRACPRSGSARGAAASWSAGGEQAGGRCRRPQSTMCRPTKPKVHCLLPGQPA